MTDSSTSGSGIGTRSGASGSSIDTESSGPGTGSDGSGLGLVAPAELAGEIAGAGARADGRLTILDVRWRLGGPPGRDDHAARRVPGAVFVDLDTELAAPPGPAGRHPLPPADALQAVLRRAGVVEGGRVVAYDDGDGSVAARAWWLLRWAGLPADRVAVLDGGFAAWLAEGGPLAGDEVPDASPEPEHGAGDVVVRPGGMPVLDADAAADLARTGILLDARAPARYRGDVEPVDPRAGHVPGARNTPSAGNAGADGRWLAPSELAARFAAAGVTGSGPVGAYCGSGVTASALVLALERSGLTRPDAPAALYPGSWSEWSADPRRPAATGDAPDGDAPDGDAPDNDAVPGETGAGR